MTTHGSGPGDAVEERILELTVAEFARAGIAVRHSNSRTTEVVYRRELRPVLTTGAEAMDRLFKVQAS